MGGARKLAVLIAGAGWAAVVSASPLPDPTRPVDRTVSAGPTAATRPAGPVLQSTLVSPTRKVAIISGQAVQVGDTVQGAVVTEISAYEVKLAKGGRELRLRLHPKLKEEPGIVE